MRRMFIDNTRVLFDLYVNPIWSLLESTWIQKEIIFKKSNKHRNNIQGALFTKTIQIWTKDKE